MDSGWPETVDGIWEVDLSDVGCAREITEWVTVQDGFDRHGKPQWWVEANWDAGEELQLASRKGPYGTEKAARADAQRQPLDECVATWKVEIVSQKES
jgi:hypothetical protein